MPPPPDRRKDNIQSRITGKLERRKEKREKKLLRAGFEGRRTSFISTPGSGSKPGGGGAPSPAAGGGGGK